MMQQTDKYKLNLIEKDDVFSPDALNENMEKVEAAISAEAAAEAAACAAGDAAVTAAFQSADAALDQRLQVFEAKRFATGRYKPENGLDIDVGFTPTCVIIFATGTNNCCGILLPDRPTSGGKLTEHGFHIIPLSVDPICQGNIIYCYFAFG